jgi:hypothetical protein
MEVEIRATFSRAQRKVSEERRVIGEAGGREGTFVLPLLTFSLSSIAYMFTNINRTTGCVSVC